MPYTITSAKHMVFALTYDCRVPPKMYTTHGEITGQNLNPQNLENHLSPQLQCSSLFQKNLCSCSVIHPTKLSYKLSMLCLVITIHFI